MERKKNVRVVLVMPAELKNKLQEAADNSYTQFSSWCRQRLAEALPKQSGTPQSAEPKLTAKERKAQDNAERKEAIFAYISEHGGCSSNSMACALSFNPGETFQIVNELIDSGAVTFTGVGDALSPLYASML